ncbi:HAD family hydrolase [Desulfovibrio desulfuricans]|uniref:HAD family hydrolase n=1 Tax=Desulfovibrio desulfuricans TaxID=876 RepID=A0A4V1CWZ7_DESDE|nr:HAD family hydrolase [Desulfovibrio desulfuricans]QCC84460.1 HAD family hydrolase [Desulfovibrio desulfuricans]
MHTITLPKAVCFDLDNTLYSYQPCNKAGMAAVYLKLYKNFSLEESKSSILFSEARKQIKQKLGDTAASHSRLLYFQRMLELMGLNAQVSLVLDLEQTFWRAYLQQAELFAGVKDFIYALRARNIAIAIVSDMTAQIQLRKLMHLDIDGLIDQIITSEETGHDKPHPSMFTLALEKLGTEPAETWMIGDDFERDVQGAIACGMVGVFKGEHAAPAAPKYPDFRVLPSFEYGVKLVEGAGG